MKFVWFIVMPFVVFVVGDCEVGRSFYVESSF